MLTMMLTIMMLLTMMLTMMMLVTMMLTMMMMTAPRARNATGPALVVMTMLSVA